MDDNPVFSLFEGVCPSCGAPVKMKSISGTPDFLEHYTFTDSPEPDVWPVRELYGDEGTYNAIGSIVFICDNGHQSYTECNRFGEWL